MRRIFFNIAQAAHAHNERSKNHRHDCHFNHVHKNSAEGGNPRFGKFGPVCAKQQPGNNAKHQCYHNSC